MDGGTDENWVVLVGRWVDGIKLIDGWLIEREGRMDLCKIFSFL